MQPNYPFVDIKIVQTFKLLERAIQWRIDPVFQDIGPFNFTVEVAETADFSEFLYFIAASNDFYAIDDTKQRQGEAVDLYYRVRLDTGSDHTYYSPILIHYARGEKRHLYLKAKEIIRREFVRFRYTGQPGWILKRKNYGEQDPTNIDPITGVPLSSNSTDYGTGFTGGYYKPLKVTFSREGIDGAVKLNEQGFGTSTLETQKHRFVGFPCLEPYDIVINDTNQRYRYDKVSPTFMPGTGLVMIQLCDAILLPPTDPIYSIKVPNDELRD